MPSRTIKRLLVANRGEPVRRAVRTCRSLDIAVCGVYVDADRASDWISECDISARIGSYLDIEGIIDAAKRVKADAIWPGWGFISESGEFARKVIDAGIIWIGPNPDAMERLGHKGAASSFAREAGLTVIPEKLISPNDISSLSVQQFSDLGFPLLIKPAMGGGGQGQVVIRGPEEFTSRLEEAARLNGSQFNGGDLVVQRLLRNVRHIEFQLLADSRGNVAVLFERDCSVQRRNQKVIEESPSPVLPETLRKETMNRIGEFARSIGYSSAGTVEFLFSGDRLYFLEVNTRLQVEHTVTEEALRVHGERPDILKEMISIAEGNPLSFAQHDIVRERHAIEARIYAEDVWKDFRPAPGNIFYMSFPHLPDIRIDSAFSGSGASVPPDFDPMIAKVVAGGKNRGDAVKKLVTALKETVILGVPTNVSFCINILSNGAFKDGGYSTSFIADNIKELLKPREFLWQMIAVSAIVHYRRNGVRESSVRTDDCEFSAVVSCFAEDRYIVLLNGSPVEVGLVAVSAYDHIMEACGRSFKTRVMLDGGAAHVAMEGESAVLSISGGAEEDVRKDPYLAPTGGRVVAIKAGAGDRVRKNDVLYVVEAMKMETSVRALSDGRVRSVLMSTGDVVEAGDRVVEFEPSETATAAAVTGKVMHKLALPDPSPLAAAFKEPVSLLKKNDGIDTMALIMNYFAGYDVPKDIVKVAGRLAVKSAGEKALPFMAKLVRHMRDIAEAASEEHASSIRYFIEHIGEKEKRIPKAALGLIERIFRNAYSCEPGDVKRAARMAPYFKASFEDNLEGRLVLLHEIVSFIAQDPSLAAQSDLLEELVSLTACGFIKSNANLFERFSNLLKRLDRDAYYRVTEPPVASEYLTEYQEHLSMGFAVPDGDAVKCGLPEPVAAWFDHPETLRLPVTKEAEAAGVSMYKVGKRFVAVASPSKAEAILVDGAIHSIPEIERGAIEAYRSMRAYVKNGTGPNHIFIVVPRSFVLPWSADDKAFSLSLSAVKKVSKRVAGFAHGLNISSTEVIIHLKNEKGEEIRSVLEVRHAGAVGVISRPPYPVTEREVEKDDDAEKLLNDKQQRLGKLLNRDRAKLLFDDGAYEEIRSSMFCVPDDVPVGLNVYKGRICGADALCYAGDYRIQGGSLGENEGKKLAATVVLAYCMGVPLIGIHDGAGANIKGSVASLGWAGAYFGAVANTGGFSDHERFLMWFKGHHERKYFEQVLNNFELCAYDLERWHAPLKHIHLNLGAAVGMLVYGSSISNMTIMVDHPEVYRVLTGAATVRKVIGEDATNYELGGAAAHARKSGDIDIRVATEDAAIRYAREMVLFLRDSVNGNIKRSVDNPRPALPVSGSIIFGRDAILANVDDGVFHETRKEMEGGGALMTGFARIGGKPVVIVASATDHGISDGRAFKKACAAFCSAQEFRLPVILVFGDRFDALTCDADARTLHLHREMLKCLCSLKVPKINITLGPAALMHQVNSDADAVIYVRRGNENEHQLKRAKGVAHFFAGSAGEAFDLANALLNAARDSGSAIVHVNSEIRLPEETLLPYDMRSLISAVFDKDSFLELFGSDGEPLITGLARLGGKAVGIVADDPEVLGGAQTLHSISKFTRFNRLCERFGLPVVQLNDSPAFTPGSLQEQGGIQGEGGRSIREECLSGNLKIAVTLRQNYGGRLIHANLKTLGPPRKGLVIENAKVGVMGAKGAVGVLYGKKLSAIDNIEERNEAEKRYILEYEREKLSPERMMELGYADEMVNVCRLREALLGMVS